MNSIFTSFDAICAEILGQKINSFVAYSKEGSKTESEQKGLVKKAIEEMKGNRSGKDGLSPPAPVRNSAQQDRALRFAVEFDGLNCFETIVSR